MDLRTSILIVAALLALDLLITASRTSYTNIRLARLTAAGENGGGAGRLARLLLKDQSGLALQLAIIHQAVRFAIVWQALAAFVLPSGGQFAVFSLGALVVVLAIVVALAEWTVQVRALLAGERGVLALARFTRATLVLFWPVTILPVLLARAVLPQGPKGAGVTADELNVILDTSQEQGVLEEEQREMISSVFRLSDTLVREIMIPRIDLLALEVNTSLPGAVDAMLASGFSRVPVYEGTVDHLVGILYVKDLLRMTRAGALDGSLRDQVRPAYFVPETKKVDELLTEMQKIRTHIAIVVDEYGGVAGLATLEDIVEELVGEIQDEYDQAEEQPYQELENGEALFLGRIDLDDFNEVMQVELPKDEAETLGGLMYSRFGRVPKVGESIQEGSVLLTVEQVVGRRIRRVRAHKSGTEAVYSE